MADATRKTVTKTVEKVVTEEVEENVITLTLSEDEAAFLRVILHRVGGHPKTSLRTHEAPINKALANAGVELDRDYLETFDDERGFQAICFKDNTWPKRVVIPSLL